MKSLDNFLQEARIRQVASFIPRAARVLDIGSHEGVLFARLGKDIDASIGIDPHITKTAKVGHHQLIRGLFPADMPSGMTFDVVTMLAVLEHIPPAEYPAFSAGVWQYLKPGGSLIITVPSKWVDPILHVLRFFRLIDGMSLEEHHGFEVSDTLSIFEQRFFHLVLHRRFQLGLNNLFVFRKHDSGH